MNALMNFFKLIFLLKFASISAWNPLSYCFRDCCGEFKFHQEKLQKNLDQKLHGQPLVNTNVPATLARHFSTHHSTKAMALSFHGWTGSGKNYASQMIAESMFSSGMKSSSVKLFIANIDFTNHASVDEYKKELQLSIIKQIKRCSRALFIFDEIEKMPIGLLDAIKPFLDHYQDVGGVDPRNVVFLFLSNSAGKVINEMVYNDWLENKPRDLISLSTIQSKLSSSAYNEFEGGFWHAFLIESHVITSFIPFLPLERRHVILCIEEESRRAGLADVNQKAVEDIADQIAYWPQDTQVFSLSGCKRIPELVKINFFSLAKNLNLKNEL